MRVEEAKGKTEGPPKPDVVDTSVGVKSLSAVWIPAQCKKMIKAKVCGMQRKFLSHGDWTV